MLKELAAKSRSYRRFHEDFKIGRRDLEELVDLARLTAFTANKQPLKAYLSREPETNSMFFPTLAWAGYLPAGGDIRYRCEIEKRHHVPKRSLGDILVN